MLYEEYFSIAQPEWCRLVWDGSISYSCVLRTADFVTDFKLESFLGVTYRMIGVMLAADLVDSLAVHSFHKHTTITQYNRTINSVCWKCMDSQFSLPHVQKKQKINEKEQKHCI